MHSLTFKIRSHHLWNNSIAIPSIHIALLQWRGAFIVHLLGRQQSEVHSHFDLPALWGETIEVFRPQAMGGSTAWTLSSEVGEDDCGNYHYRRQHFCINQSLEIIRQRERLLIKWSEIYLIQSADLRESQQSNQDVAQLLLDGFRRLGPIVLNYSFGLMRHSSISSLRA